MRITPSGRWLKTRLMRQLGHESFYVGSHDRGARAAHRLCLDHPEAVRKVCFMDIVPTLRMYRDTTCSCCDRKEGWDSARWSSAESLHTANCEVFLTESPIHLQIPGTDDPLPVIPVAVRSTTARFLVSHPGLSGFACSAPSSTMSRCASSTSRSGLAAAI